MAKQFLKGVHHAHLGILLLIAGFYILFYYLYIGLVIAGLGLWLFIDDVYQHAVHHYNPAYRSPVNRLGAWVWKRCKVYRDIQKWFDKLLGN